MSLINEALRKARSEAASREGRSRALPTALAGGPRRRRTGVGLVVVTLVAAAAGLAGAAVAWWAFGRDATPPARPATAVAVEPAAPGSLPTPAPGPTPQAVVGQQPAGISPDATVRGGPAPDESPSAPIVEGPASEPHAAGAAVTADPAPVDLPTPVPPRRAAPERSFVLTAELGYARLHLDYIVYKPSAPFGRVNGQDIVVGTVVDGFVVEEIGESHVRLRDSRGVVVLRVR